MSPGYGFLVETGDFPAASNMLEELKCTKLISALVKAHLYAACWS